ncbi:MAG: putative membrane protein [uncultured archaeon A07HB70]|nr:MAG: putative membrane protein [uncultured archaeon A07HB70]
MTDPLRRAGGFAAVGTLALAAPALGRAAAVPFALVAVCAAFVVDEGALFDLFARPGDEREGRLSGLAGFALAAAGLAVLTAFTGSAATMPVPVYVASVLVLAYGNLGERLVERSTDDPFLATAGFATTGFAAALAGQTAVVGAADLSVAAPRFAFLAAAAALAAALFRTVLYVRDDPLVMVSVGVLLWLFDAVAVAVTATAVGVALALTVVLGVVSYAIGTASVTGMLTGVLLGLLTVVLGGFGWLLVLLTFFGVGGLSTKFRYERKLERGVAEGDGGARGTENVLGNAAVALVAVVGFAAADLVPGRPVDPAVFRLVFAGSLAAAMADTLSSEVGGLFDGPRLVTTLERVAPGTDGAVTWQGTAAGVVGAAAVAAVSLLFVTAPTAVVVGAVAFAGVTGMFADSLLGATVEGERVGNEVVNLLATATGGAVAVALAVALAPLP